MNYIKLAIGVVSTSAILALGQSLDGQAQMLLAGGILGFIVLAIMVAAK